MVTEVELTNPVVDEPDMTECPDPHDRRQDPPDPVDPHDAPCGEEPHPPTGAGSTSEPALEQEPEVEAAPNRPAAKPRLLIWSDGG